MGLPIRFCQEGFLGHNYPLRPMLYILGDKVCQTQGVLLCESTSQKNPPPGPGVGGPCTPTSVEERLYHCLTSSHPLTPGRSDTRVAWNLLNSLLSVPGPPPLPHSSEHPPPLGGGGARLAPCYSIQDWAVSSTWVGSMGCTSCSLLQVSFIQDKSDQISQIWLYGPGC